MWLWKKRPGSKKFSELLKRWPWPENARILGIDPFQWTLDGGGRHLMQTIFSALPDCLLVELGSFMGGAPRVWLASNPGLRCVCVDPWDDDYLVPYTKSLRDVSWAIKSYGVEKIDRNADLVRRFGGYAIARNNLAEFKDRCVMVRGAAPEIFQEFLAADVEPDVVFIDAMKQRIEFIETHKAFPNAIITGDDWSWGKREDGSYPVREFVEELALARKAKIYADRATFVIAEPRHNLLFDEKYLYKPQTIAA
jgi:hypothetical protein